METYRRGSEWNKWDLHIHTPASLCSDYGGDTDEVWSKFLSELENLPQEIKVIGINDYLFLDGYKKVLEYKKEGRLQNIELILPVIEVRIKEFVGNDKLNRINYHIIFADTSQLPVEVIEYHFLAGLRGKANLNSEYTDGYSWGGIITKESLSDFGRHIYYSTPKEKRGSYNPLEIGFNNINFEISKIKELLGEGAEPNTYLAGKYFKAIGKTEWEQFRWDGSIADKKTIINDVHFIFSASPSAEEANKGIASLKAQSVNSRLLHCSDAHQFAANKINTRPKELGHCFTWLKASPTFEGLRQVIFEPELRRKIQRNNPNNKRLDRVIKSVQFTGHSDFTSQKIYLNPDLNTIIGGKSSGKSLLLHYIANTIDYKYACKQEQEEISQTVVDSYNFRGTESFDFIVEWEDNVQYKYNDNTTAKNRQFVYIPQSYIIKLTSNIQNNTRKELGKFIRDILLQDNESKLHYDEFIQKVKELDNVRDNAIDEYFKIQAQIDVLKQQKKDIGDVLGINNQITHLNTSIEDLKGNSVVDTELIKYNTLTKRRDKTQTIRANIINEYASLDSVFTELDSLIANINSRLTVATETSKNKYFNNIFSTIRSKINGFQQEIESLKTDGEQRNTKFSSRIDEINKEIETQLSPIKAKLQNREQIISIEEEIKRERTKLLRISNIEDQIKTLEKLRDNEKSKFLKGYEDAYAEYRRIIDVLNAKAASIADICLTGSIKFYYNRFRNNFLEFFNQRSTDFSQFDLLSERDSNSLPDVDFTNHFNEIKLIFNLIIQGNATYRKYKEPKGSIKALFRDEFFDYWELRIGGDEMAKMSPGKANLAVLKLLIELSEANCPILIDQPEDNLDNRSIYNDLVQFIRKRKENRQLIIVTHNPNIVVGADSENIIVANQRGQDENRNNESCRFEYINGALEHTLSKQETSKGVLFSMGIREHITDILEGGREAFKKREEKYGF